MNGPETKDSQNAIRELIEAEEREALVRFRHSRFGDRLKARLDDRDVGPVRSVSLRPALRPVWVLLAVLTIAAGAALWLLKPLSRPLSDRLAVDAALHRSPGLHAIESGDVPLRDTSHQSKISPRGTSHRATRLEENFVSVLTRYRRAAGASSPERPRFAPATPLSPPLGLRRVYEILVIDRSVERVLKDISQKTKEG